MGRPIEKGLRRRPQVTLLDDSPRAFWESRHMNRSAGADRLDPLYQHTKREARWIVRLWLVAMIYTCSVCYLFGYTSHPPDPASTGPAIGGFLGPLHRFDRTGPSLTFPLGWGIPDWVFYGVVIPWIVSILASIYFCYVVFHEDDLGDDAEQAGDGVQRALDR